MDESKIIVSDASIFNAFLSEEHELKESADIIIQFLILRKTNKKIIIPLQTYEKILKELDINQIIEFKSFFKPADFAGSSEGVKESEDLDFIYEYLEYRYDGDIILVTDEHSDDLKHHTPNSVIELAKYLKKDKDFNDYLFERYYDSSSI